jgi:peptide-methionine (S)-S-oxide reductase
MRDDRSDGMKERAMTERATFGAGCFWGVEYVYRMVPGVVDVMPGYAGGFTSDPTYRDVCSGTTGHAEVVEVTFDSAVVSYDQLLEVFWGIHDPTQVDRQGPDVGTQYRSIILTHGDEQRLAAEASRDRAQAHFERPIATEIVEAGAFTPAEEYHRRYYEHTGHTPYCHAIPPNLLRDLGLVPAS